MVVVPNLSDLLKETLDRLPKPYGVEDLQQKLRNNRLKQDPPTSGGDSASLPDKPGL